jgi:hypothetical protein
MVARDHVGPTVAGFGDRRDRGRHAQVRRRIVRAGPVELGVETICGTILGARTVRRDDGRELGGRRRDEKAGPFRRAQPLVTVARVPGHAGGELRTDIERELTRRMRTVDDHVDVARRERTEQAIERHAQRGRARDVIEQRELRARRDRGLERIDECILVEGQGNRHDDDLRTTRARDAIELVLARAILVARREQFVARVDRR